MVREFERAGESKLLISSAGSGSAVEGDGDFATGDEAEAAVERAEPMKPACSWPFE